MPYPDSWTVAQLREYETVNPNVPQYGHRVSSRTYQQFLKTLYVEIDTISRELVSDRNYLQKHSENTLNADICRLLRRAGYSADFDKNNGGHSDITVGYETFQWIGEGKKVKSVNNSHLKGGYDQLLDRYVSGTSGADQAGVVIYCYAADASRVMQKWCDHLKAWNAAAPNYAENITALPGNEKFSFTSENKHSSTGSLLQIKHIILPLYWSPGKSP